MSNPRVGAYVLIPDDCPVRCAHTGGGDVEVLLGSPRNGFEMVFEPEALGRFVDVASRALAAPVPDDANASTSVA
jgi:hypothetical protein